MRKELSSGEPVSGLLLFHHCLDFRDDLFNKPATFIFISDLEKIVSPLIEKLLHFVVRLGPDFFLEPIECIQCGHVCYPESEWCQLRDFCLLNQSLYSLCLLPKGSLRDLCSLPARQTTRRVNRQAGLWLKTLPQRTPRRKHPDSKHRDRRGQAEEAQRSQRKNLYDY